MVKSYLLLLFYLLGFSLHAQEVSVEASINQNLGTTNQSLNGTVTVTHPKKSSVDTQSFHINKKPLTVTLNKEVTISPGDNGIVISIYDFELEGKPKGLYTLDPISVKVGNKTYQSLPAAYEVKNLTFSSQSSGQPNTAAQAPLIFRLDASVVGSTSLYPGQRTKLVYRISYNRSVDLTQSDLPFLHTEELTKIGDEQIKDYEQNNVTYQDITQEIEASKPGTYHFGPSVIEGYTYQVNNLGQKVYDPNKVRAEAPVVVLTVNPFPNEHQPASFIGAIGKIEGQLKLMTPAALGIGEKIQLQLSLSGPSNVADLSLPNLLCQPGFSGFFELNNLPTTLSVKNGVKTFQLELRPVSQFATQIPPIEISSFDPKSAQYVSWHSEPIPLHLNLPNIPVHQELLPIKENSSSSVLALWQDPSITPKLEKMPSIANIDLTRHWLNTYWVLGLIPLGLGLFALQLYLLNRWKNKQVVNQLPYSEILLKKALRMPANSPAMLAALKQAFLQRLKERRILNANEEVEDIPLEGKWKNIHDFLQDLEAMQYGPVKQINENIQQQAAFLFATC